MSIIDLFSRRQQHAKGVWPDVYVYDKMPDALRIQIVHLLFEALGNPREYNHDEGRVQEAYKVIVDTLCREYGLFRLPYRSDYGNHHLGQLVGFLLQEPDVEKVIDAIELSFKMIDGATRDWGYLHRNNGGAIADAVIIELNHRFLQHGVGYHFNSGEIMRVDSELIHTEVVKPALRLLSQKRFSGAQNEFLTAHEHYRSGESKAALNECLKAFESTMKVICDKRSWKYSKTATAKELIQICFDKELVPSFWQQSFASLRSLLESSIPTGRNRLSGHGQGASDIEVPDFLVSYMLHMTAATIVFLAEADSHHK